MTPTSWTSMASLLAVGVALAVFLDRAEAGPQIVLDDVSRAAGTSSRVANEAVERPTLRLASGGRPHDGWTDAHDGNDASAVIARGEALFHDTRLSGNREWACGSCHPQNGHTNNKTYIGVSVVDHGDPRGRSTPTLWGAGTRQTFSWAGTAPSLEANIKGIIVKRMKGAEPSQQTLDALVAYVRELSYPDNPLLRADGTPAAAASEAARRGHALFAGKAGCTTCHVLPTYDKEGVEDVGSGGEFKIPSLRVVSKTAPYFHDGRYATLKAATRAMWEYMQAAGTTETLSDADIDDLVAFLEIL